jgi:hypothetical protein
MNSIALTSTPRVGWASINTLGATDILKTRYDICLKISIIQ